MKHYNIALCPDDVNITDEFYRQAQGFLKSSDGYCLNAQTAFPHATLTQFYAETDEYALECTQPFLDRSVHLIINGVYFIKGTHEHEGKFWFGYNVERDDRLIALQSDIVDHLSIYVCKVLNGTGNLYFPHFTLARFSSPTIDIPESIMSGSLLVKPIACKVRVGASDSNGQFLRFIPT